jgi:hypothetical protein
MAGFEPSRGCMKDIAGLREEACEHARAVAVADHVAGISEPQRQHMRVGFAAQ